MKTKLISIVLFTAVIFFALTMTVNAAPAQKPEFQTIVTPQPVYSTSTGVDCVSSYDRALPHSFDCEQRKDNKERIGINSFPENLDPTSSLIWQQVTKPTANFLTNVSMISASDGWAVGDAGTIIHWNGSTWQSISSPTVKRLNAVHMLASSNGWAVGDEGTILRWNGSSWLKINSPTLIPLSSIFMISANDGWAVGGSTPDSVILHWNGTAWSNVTIPDISPAILLDIDMVSSTDGWAVGNYGKILHWNGSSWKLVDSPTDLYIISIDMISATNGWAVGGIYPNGQIFHWDGSSWKLYSAPASNELASVSMISATDGWAVSYYGGELLHWDGTGWTILQWSAGVTAIDMLSSTDGWGVGSEILHYSTFNGLTVHVDDAGGQPAYGATVILTTLEGDYAGYGGTNAGGDAYLNVLPGTYNVIVYSESDHFGLYKQNITSPSEVNLTAEGSPTITLTAKKRDGAPLDQAFVRVALSSGIPDDVMHLGQVDANGQMTFNVSPGIYDVNVIDGTNYYSLLKRQQNFSGVSGTLDFDMSTQPTAEIEISHPGESYSAVSLRYLETKIFGVWFINVTEGAHIVISPNEEYRAIQELQKDDTSGNHWFYDLKENQADAALLPGEVGTFTAGGGLSVSGRTESAYVGEYITVANPQDSFGNSLIAIYVYNADYSEVRDVFPSITLTDPNSFETPLEWNGYDIPYTAPTGFYGVYFEWDTGPYQGLISASSVFEIKPISTSATISTSGGDFTSTFDNTSYSFQNGTFTDEVTVTHTVRFTEIPSFGQLLGIGHVFDITAVYSSTGQPAQPTQPYTITIIYADDEMGFVKEESLALYYWDGNQWVMETSSEVDLQNNVLTASPNHFSLWAVLGEARQVNLPFISK